MVHEGRQQSTEARKKNQSLTQKVTGNTQVSRHAIATLTIQYLAVLG